MSVNTERNLKGSNTIQSMEVSSGKTNKQAGLDEGMMSSGADNNPITITRRINIKIQGSMSDFAQVSIPSFPVHTINQGESLCSTHHAPRGVSLYLIVFP